MPESEPIDEHRPTKRIRFGEQDVDTPVLDIKPLGRTSATTKPTQTAVNFSPVPAAVESRSNKPTKEDLAAIIAAATAAATPSPVKPDSTISNGHTETSKKSSKDSSSKSKGNRDKRLLKLVGAVVVKSMSKYQSQMDHEVFKKHAKQVIKFLILASSH